MEKRMILAIVLSMLVLIGSFMIQAIRNPSPEQIPSTGNQQESVVPQPSGPVPAVDITMSDIPNLTGLQVIDEDIEFREIEIITDVLRVVLNNEGGNIISYQLLEHLDDGAPVEMILSGNFPAQAFAVALGSRSDVISGSISPESRFFHVGERNDNDNFVEFYQIYTNPVTDTQFSLRKRFEFRPGEYMFRLEISLEAVNSNSLGDTAYTLIFGPQIGPMFEQLDGRYEFRRYYTYSRSGNRGSMDEVRGRDLNEREPYIINPLSSWAAIAGKYFTLAIYSPPLYSEVAFATHRDSGLPADSRLYVTRNAENSFRMADVYHFYLGPKSQDILFDYERGNNSFGFRDTGLADIADTRGFLAPLERLLKWFLVLFYGVIPNYGVAIILLTILVKIVMFPLTRKSSESTLRMQALAPKIKELQEKHKDNKMKLNQEMAEFYKKEGYNPLSGCLPMLLQMPIFFAMFSLFNNHFDLRGAMFIPGWITDLSQPESILDFPNNPLPFLGWTALRVLPFIYVGSQLLYGKVTQNPTQGGTGQMKMMLYAMPIIFFFVLYNMPSGLLVYWIMSNVLTMVQQLIINKYILAKKATEAAQEPPPVIAPSGPKKRKKK